MNTESSNTGGTQAQLFGGPNDGALATVHEPLPLCLETGGPHGTYLRQPSRAHDASGRPAYYHTSSPHNK